MLVAAHGREQPRVTFLQSDRLGRAPKEASWNLQVVVGDSSADVDHLSAPSPEEALQAVEGEAVAA